MKIKNYKFRSKLLGENLEYAFIQDEDTKAIIFENDNKIFVLKAKSNKQYIEKLIDNKIYTDCLEEIIRDQQEEILCLKNKCAKEGLLQ